MRPIWGNPLSPFRLTSSESPLSVGRSRRAGYRFGFRVPGGQHGRGCGMLASMVGGPWARMGSADGNNTGGQALKAKAGNLSERLGAWLPSLRRTMAWAPAAGKPATGTGCRIRLGDHGRFIVDETARVDLASAREGIGSAKNCGAIAELHREGRVGDRCGSHRSGSEAPACQSRRQQLRRNLPSTWVQLAGSFHNVVSSVDSSLIPTGCTKGFRAAKPPHPSAAPAPFTDSAMYRMSVHDGDESLGVRGRLIRCLNRCPAI